MRGTSQKFIFFSLLLSKFVSVCACCYYLLSKLCSRMMAKKVENPFTCETLCLFSFLPSTLPWVETLFGGELFPIIGGPKFSSLAPTSAFVALHRGVGGTARVCVRWSAGGRAEATWEAPFRNNSIHHLPFHFKPPRRAKNGSPPCLRQWHPQMGP